MDSKLDETKSFNGQYAYIIPKVSVDGEPHEVLILVAAFSGVIAATIILIIIIILIGCGDPKKYNQKQLSTTTKTQSTATNIDIIIPGIVQKYSQHSSSELDTTTNKDEIILKVITLPKSEVVRY